MKIEYAGICANVLEYCPLPCPRCVFIDYRKCIGRYKFDNLSCGIDGFEKDPGYIFKL
jgi:hypothetical protein